MNFYLGDSKTSSKTLPSIFLQPKKENKPEWAASNKQPTTPTTPRTVSLSDMKAEVDLENDKDEEEEEEEEEEDEEEMDEEVEEVELRMSH